MLSPSEIRKKAQSRWRGGQIPRAAVTGEELFPLRIPWGRPTARQLRDDFAGVRERIAELRHHSGPEKMGYTIEWQTINHRRLGRQEIPVAVLFSLPDLLRCIGKQEVYQRFLADLALIRDREPRLEKWVAEHPMEVVRQAGKWPRLLMVLDHLAKNSRPRLYLRQLDIPGVDTKFIEQHKKILATLLDRVLPEDAVDASVTGLAHHGFERRYGLRFDEPLIRLRYLDEKQAVHPSCTDISLPLSGFIRLHPPCRRIIITENKINGLSFPPVRDAVIIFGLGYGIKMLAAAGWLREKSVWYWGDIDTHGFAILSLVRSFLPATRSFLMDQETLMAHQSLWGREDAAKRCLENLRRLTPAEQELHEILKENRLGENIRLEQERIGFGRVRGAAGLLS